MKKPNIRQNIETYTVVPIGSVKRCQGKTYIDLLEPYVPALKQIEHFSHLHVFWWGSAFDAENYRTITQNQPLYDAPVTGVFASRSSVRPNPIGLSATPIVQVDHAAGRIEIANIDAYDNTPVLDLKVYFPSSDRVKTANVPQWAADWPEWLPDDGLRLDVQESDPPQSVLAEHDEFAVVSIGDIQKKNGMIILRIQEPYRPALKQLEHFSHVQVLWWFHRFDKKQFRRITACNPPYEHAPRTGVFASRSPVRPNPIGLSTARILSVHHEQGLVEIAAIDAFDKTPLLDLKAYFPCCDRVKTFAVPEWVRHWPEWAQEAETVEIVTPQHLQPSDSERLTALAGNPLTPPPPSPESGEGMRERLTAPDDPNQIIIRGARTHNLKNVTVAIPRNQFTVITGVSGSGKSSLAFDTLYAEGQRRYMEGLSSQARQLLDQMEKPNVERISGLPPTIALEQKTVSRNPRSTVGTITQIYDFLRVLFARIGTRHCPQCGRAVQPQTARQMVAQLSALMPGTRFTLQDQEFEIPVQATTCTEFMQHLSVAVEASLKAERETLTVLLENGESLLLTEHDACPHCDRIFFGLTPALFSFNNPDGMCSACNGLGVKLDVDPALIVTNPEISLLDGASPWYGNLRQVKPSGNWMRSELFALADHFQVDLEQPWNELPQHFREAALYGTGDEIIRWSYDMKKRGRSIAFERPVQGAVNNIKRLLQQSDSDVARKRLLIFFREQPCPTCQGERLCPEARFVMLGGKRYPEAAMLTIAQLQQWIETLPQQISPEQQQITRDVLTELHARLQALRNVGLHYLTLDRSAPTLSGGEGQRIRLASQLNGGLTGLLYVLDEPSIGLHPRDHQALLHTIRQLQTAGNTVVVVEHDADTMRAADWLIDLGPGAGVLGGDLRAVGTPEAVMAHPQSLTGQYLRGDLRVARNDAPRRTAQHWLTVQGARLHNLKNLAVRFPLEVVTCVTGVSGSGKSSLVAQTLAPALERLLNGTQNVAPGVYDRIDGIKRLDKLVTITQTPIGRTPRSNPATYIGVFDDIRKVFASTSEAKARKYKADRFSFNSKGGRCEACQGDGRKRIEMHFLPDVWVTCSECQGRRFNQETLEITYNDRTIADVLTMDVRTASTFFADHANIQRILTTLCEVGLEYIELGQSALTLSGGEAQRVKLAKELCRPDTGRTIYILDEPTTGLHFADIQKLLDVLQRLTDSGNTVIIIEHNLDVIHAADWVIDLGPEGGEGGGYLVAQGTPEQVAQVSESYTGQFLRSGK